MLESELFFQGHLSVYAHFSFTYGVGPCGTLWKKRQEHFFYLTSCLASAEECSEIEHNHVTLERAES